MNLCLPYASVYMLALGMSDIQLGMLVTIGMLSQVVFGLLGGIITDKLGRRLTTALFDVVAWGIPCLIWFAASLVNPTWAFWFFLGASIINGTFKVTQNSWDCLMVEDATRDQITGIYSLVIVAGHLSAIFAPIAAVLVAQFSLVMAVRILYLNAFVVMMIKIIWLYRRSHETDMGVKRRQETKGVSIWKLLVGYAGVLKIILRSRGTIFSLVIAIIVTAVGTINSTFWQVVVSKKLQTPEALLPIFAMGRSMIAMIFLFTVVPRITKTLNLRQPLLIGFVVYVIGQVLLASIPAPETSATASTYVAICVSLVFDGFGVGILAMLAESLVALHVDREERSRVMAVQHTIIMLAVSPFGWISGILSDISRSLPFVLTAIILALGILVTVVYYRRNREMTPSDFE